MRTIIFFCALFACGLAATYEDVKIVIRDENGLDGTPETRDTEDESCPKQFEKWSKAKGLTHTMCDPKYEPETSGTVTKDQIKEIVDKHNTLRSDPQTTETAKQMCKVYWDPNIATIAQRLADACPTVAENHDDHRDVPGYGISVGQNMAWFWGYGSWDDAIQSWFNEVKDFEFGKGSINGKPVGHYTQVVKDTTCRIGCGFAQCGFVKTYVCNYATGQSDYKTPFVPGTPCTDCKKCSNNLCDCKGLMCYNGGSIDYKTCKCKCHPLYEGKFCDELKCPSGDPGHCGTQWPVEYCKIYSNVPTDCPHMCKTCKNFIKAPKAKLQKGTV